MQSTLWWKSKIRFLCVHQIGGRLFFRSHFFRLNFLLPHKCYTQSVMPISNPTQLVDAYKKSGEFDRLRRELLASFQRDVRLKSHYL